MPLTCKLFVGCLSCYRHGHRELHKRTKKYETARKPYGFTYGTSFVRKLTSFSRFSSSYDLLPRMNGSRSRIARQVTSYCTRTIRICDFVPQTYGLWNRANYYVPKIRRALRESDDLRMVDIRQISLCLNLVVFCLNETLKVPK